MSDEMLTDYFRTQAEKASEPAPGRPSRRRSRPRQRSRRRLLIRLALAGGLSMALLAGAVAGGGYLAVNHLVSGIHRIPGIIALDAKVQKAVPAWGGGLTVLLTASHTEPASRGGSGVDGSSTSPENPSGLIMLLHLNANHHGGAIVSIPANAVVHIPGHGRQELWNTLKIGGPSLLIETVEYFTRVRISHYSVIDLAGASQIVGAMGGVEVDVPYTTTSMGFTFPAGLDLINAANVHAYISQPAVSEIGRELLQQNFLRAVLDKLASQHMLSHIATDYAVLHAIASALSVDSDFSNSELESLALRLGSLKGHDGVFVDAPTVNGSPTSGGTAPVRLSTRLSDQLWWAVRHDSVAEFAHRHPSLMTPIDPG